MTLRAPVAEQWHVKLFDPFRQLVQPWPMLLPSNPGDPVLPLAIGTDKALVARLAAPDDEVVGQIKIAIRRYCMTSQYAAAMSQDGAMRHALDGTPVEPVSAEHRQHRVRSQASAHRPAPAKAEPEPVNNTTEAIMVAVKSLKITAVLPPDQLKPSDAGTVALVVTTADGATATAMIAGKAYRRALTQIAAIGADQAVVVLQGAMKKPGEIEGAGIAVSARKTD